MSTDQTLVWKALSDPTRRRILDFLRIKPYTIEELNKSFEISRIGLLKHIKVLNNANLVQNSKKGRKNLYRLNVVPLQDIYNRWMRPYEEIWSQSLINLKNIVESE